MDEPSPADEPAPEFGPGGYLPDRASRRARKIVLRAPMGLQWVVGALVVGAIVAVAGWLALRDTTPEAPYEVVPVTIVETDGGVALWSPDGSDADALVVTVGGRSRVFAWAGDVPPVVCDESGLLEGEDGTVWRVTGRGLAGTPSLREHPIVVDDGVLYADPTTTNEPPRPDDGPVATACR